MTARTYTQRLLAIIAWLPVLAVAQPVGRFAVQVGRYSTVPAVPLPEQIHLLSAMVTVTLPKREVETVGDALHYLLRQSGYRLAEAYASDPAVKILLSRPLPDVQRQLGPCSLQTALTTLAGPVYRLVVDSHHRLVSFEFTQHYRTLVRASSAVQPNEANGK